MIGNDIGVVLISIPEKLMGLGVLFPAHKKIGGKVSEFHIAHVNDSPIECILIHDVPVIHCINTTVQKMFCGYGWHQIHKASTKSRVPLRHNIIGAIFL